MYSNQNNNSSLNVSYANSANSKSATHVSKTKQMKQKYDDSYLNRPIMEESYHQRPVQGNGSNSHSHSRINSSTQ